MNAFPHLRTRRRTIARGLLALGVLAAGDPGGSGSVGPAHAQSPLRVAVVDSALKVRPGDVPSMAPTRIELAAARNEYESAQILVASDIPVAQLSADVSPLAGPTATIPRGDVELLLLYAVEVERPSDGRGAAGEWPDALVPLKRAFPLRAGRTQPLWLKVFIAPGTPPGTYRGTLTLSGPRVATRTVNIALEVWDITLPEHTSLPFMVGIDYDALHKFEAPDSTAAAFADQVVLPYYAALRRNRAYPFLVQGLPDYADATGKVVVRFDAFRRHLEAAYPRSAKVPVGIPLTETWPVDDKRFPLFSAEYNRRVVAYLREAAAFLDKLGLLDRAFIYLPGADEPRERAQYQHIRNFADLVRNADSRLRLLLPVMAECADCKPGEGVESVESPVTQWVLNIAFHDDLAMRAKARWFGLGGFDISAVPSGWTRNLAGQVKQRNAEVWWYLDAWTRLLPPPQPSYPSLFVDHQGIEHRILGWMAYKYGIGAISHWNATYWRDTTNVWTKPPRGEGGHSSTGDGSLLYPARGSAAVTGQPDPDGPIASLRLELVREGVEDHELLVLLRRLGDPDGAARLANSVVRSLRDFERDPARLKQVRREVAAAILRRGRTS